MQELNAHWPIVAKLDGNVREVRPLHLKKAFSSIRVKFDGKFIDVSEVQPSNA